MKIGKIIGKTIKYSILAVLCACVLYWAFSIIKCEVLTIMYYDDFVDGEKYDDYWFAGTEDFKVLSCNGVHAKVYYLGPEYCYGLIAEFYKFNGEWRCYTWYGGWSSGGSADDPVWPYFWHRDKYVAGL